ncbi:MAG: hypothetical protein WCJ86_02795 [Candidatus Saccharibacteria bacterium]
MEKNIENFDINSPETTNERIAKLHRQGRLFPAPPDTAYFGGRPAGIVGISGTEVEMVFVGLDKDDENK